MQLNVLSVVIFINFVIQSDYFDNSNSFEQWDSRSVNDNDEFSTMPFRAINNPGIMILPLYNGPNMSLRNGVGTIVEEVIYQLFNPRFDKQQNKNNNLDKLKLKSKSKSPKLRKTPKWKKD